MIPGVSNDKTDGNIAATSDTDRILAIIGPASAGPFDQPTALTSKNDVLSTFKSGLLAHIGTYAISKGIPVVLIRSNPAMPGSYGTIVTSGVHGTVTVTAGATKPDDDYDVIVETLTGGALGTAGITFRYSLDAGVSWSDETALGTSLTLTCDGGVSFTLAAAAATLLKGDSWSVSTKGPQVGTSDLEDSFNALTDYAGEWLRVLVLADADATMLAQGNAFATSFHAEGKNPEVIMNTRPRGATETVADYIAAMALIRKDVQSLEVSASVDQCEMVINGRRLRRPQSVGFAVRTMINDDSQDAAAKSDGALPEVFLTTAAGEKKYHDERRTPGLDVLGFTTLRTWGGRPASPGAYVNNPRVLSGPGSDYRYFQHSAITNRVIETSFRKLEPRLSSGVQLNKNGTIREDVAAAIEASVNAELRSLYVDSGRVSAIQLSLSRTDDVLATDTVSFSTAIVPLGYLKKLKGKTGLVRTLPAA
ncbi:hypothetical protein AKJ09_09854 [Labilithrix luteola]|uniref:Tail sheath protein n=1 Tax=Labilithrix luteola TaxID=1391654 RepID=A0A0K1QBN2_9BACT|nr:DUF2586 family protein [Labilithrix luteola]AKV03191.1 hypothetical protein AKJ09_09854 [Labilithrix luteola]